MQLLSFLCLNSRQKWKNTGLDQYFRVMKYGPADFHCTPLNYGFLGEILSFAAYRADIPLPFA